MPKNKTQEEIEKKLVKAIESWYQKKLNQELKEIKITFFDRKTALAIIIDNTLTPTEKLLLVKGEEELAQQVRWELDDLMKQELKEIIEQVCAVKVRDLLSDVTLDTGRAGVIALLAEPPQILSDFINGNGRDVDNLESWPNLVLIEELTERELEVLKLLTLGYKNEAIGEKLRLEISTVKSHIHKIIQKLGVSDRTQVVVWALRYGLID